MQPRIDVVIIGLNSARTLPACIGSVRACRYPGESISVYYADSGSTDDSMRVAESLGAVALLVEAVSPTPGRQRNAGWRAGTAELVQFLDSDTVMDPDWLGAGVAALADEGAAAACGDRRELHPERSVFNWLGNLEWNGPAGDAEHFGGDVLIRRAALERTGGYDPDLVAGEDPELAHRVRAAGYRIVKLDVPMTGHDLAMTRARQYWKRAFRSGYAFAEVHGLHKDMWGRDAARIAARAGAFLAGALLLPFAALSPWLALLFPVGFLFMINPRLRLVGAFAREMSLTRAEARTYAWHASLVVAPQFCGMARYYWGRLVGSPLRNKR
jgi:glycosyltransferase involved in cell wall biosynthesis